MYWVVMRQIDRSDGSVLTGHMWLIRAGPHRAPDTLKTTPAPRELLYVIYVFKGIGQRDKRQRERNTKSQDLDRLDRFAAAQMVELELEYNVKNTNKAYIR